MRLWLCPWLLPHERVHLHGAGGAKCHGSDKRDRWDRRTGSRRHRLYGPLCEYTCQRGYCPEGACIVADDSDSGSGSGDGPGDGEVYIAPSIWNMPSPVVQCEPPCSLIMPPLQLASPSVISIPPWESPVEQSYLTTRTTTYDDGVVETYNGYAVATTTITISFPPCTC